MDYQSYLSIPKPASFRTFAVIRDPRDIVVSWYFSVRYSHPPMGKIPQHREVLNKIPVDDGLIYCIEYLKEYGLFAALQSWISGPRSDPQIRLFRFEDLVNEERQFSMLTDLFSHCRFPFNENEIRDLMEKYSFVEMQKRAKKGQPENPEISHFRKGMPGDWRNYFNAKVDSAFAERLGNLVGGLGYREEMLRG
jgi:hypothetical protein